MPDDLALNRASGECGVGDGALDGAGLQGADFVPLGAGEADAGEAFRVGEDDATALVILGVGFVLAHHGELDAVDGL